MSIKVAAGATARAGTAAVRSTVKTTRAMVDKVRNLVSRGCKNSFVPGTLVLSGSGVYVPIESLGVGDLVWSTDPVTGQSSAQPVLAPIVGSGVKHLVGVDIEGSVGVLVATAGHPIWVEGTGWVEAGDLTPGDRVRGSTGGLSVVRATHDLGWLSGQTVHNLHVAGNHTYYVNPTGAGTPDTLAHNSACSVPKILTNPEGYTGASVRKVKKDLKSQGFIPAGLQRDGFGMRYLPASGPKGAQVLLENGRARQLARGRAIEANVHHGWYIRVSYGGKVTRVPLRGNPGLR